MCFDCSREDNSLSARTARAHRNDALDLKFGYERYVTPVDKMGWLINIHPVSSHKRGIRGGYHGYIQWNLCFVDTSGPAIFRGLYFSEV